MSVAANPIVLAAEPFTALKRHYSVLISKMVQKKHE